MGARLTFAESACRYADLLAQIANLTRQIDKLPCEVETVSCGPEDGWHYEPPCWRVRVEDNGDPEHEPPLIDVEDRCDACQKRDPLWQERRRLRRRKSALARSFVVTYCREYPAALKARKP